MSQSAHPAPQPTRADLDALPANVKGEIIDDVLYAMTRPRPKHQAVSTRITSSIEPPFGLGKAGGMVDPVRGPGIELPRSPEISPDVAG